MAADTRKGARTGPVADGGGPETEHPLAGVQKDVHALHYPPPEGPAHFDKGVGLQGYDRDTGKGVPGEPVLRLPGDKAPRARPFEGKTKGGQ